MTPDPRIQAPPRLSDLKPAEMREALLARHEAHRANYMARFAPQARPRGPVRRLFAVLFRSSAPCPLLGAGAAPPVIPPAGGADGEAR